MEVVLGLHLKLLLVLEIQTSMIMVLFLFVGLGFAGNLSVPMVKLLLFLGAPTNDKKNKKHFCYDFFSGLFWIYELEFEFA